MLENFTPEELEQIKLELGIKKPATSKERAVGDTEAGKIMKMIFPLEIENISNSARQEYTRNLHFRIADAILGNYVIRERRWHGKLIPTFTASNSLPDDQVEEYVGVCNELARFLDRLWRGHELTRMDNIADAIRAWQAGKTKKEG